MQKEGGDGFIELILSNGAVSAVFHQPLSCAVSSTVPFKRMASTRLDVGDVIFVECQEKWLRVSARVSKVHKGKRELSIRSNHDASQSPHRRGEILKNATTLQHAVQRYMPMTSYAAP